MIFKVTEKLNTINTKTEKRK